MRETVGTVQAGAVTGAVRTWLRLEGAAVLLFAVGLYAWGDHSWLLFAVLFLSPDLSFLGYLAGARVGAMTYNALHSYVGPLALAAVLLLTGHAVMLALIWAAHLGFDRLVGYGLKYPTDFKDTHLGRIGASRPQ
jgi:hypothetical protein